MGLKRLLVANESMDLKQVPELEGQFVYDIVDGDESDNETTEGTKAAEEPA